MAHSFIGRTLVFQAKEKSSILLWATKVIVGFSSRKGDWNAGRKKLSPIGSSEMVSYLLAKQVARVRFSSTGPNN